MKANLRGYVVLNLGIGLFCTGCTGQIPGSFRYLQQVQTFDSTQSVNTKIDLLWVVDNSSSMDASQEKLRAGFQSFASKYLQPTWDIRVAVITTDLYMAHPAFAPYLNTVVPGSEGYHSNYIASRLGTFVNPSFDPNLINLSTGDLDNGIKYGDINPLWGPNYAKLLPGLHDGPVTAFCFEGMPWFLHSVTQCADRDNQNQNVGPSHCLNPNVENGESPLSQCVNTVENDSVRSSVPIISTMPPQGTPGDAAWVQGLVNNFMINASTGSSGSGSERGLSSVLQLLSDNETTETAFFRPGSLRGIIFLSDEDDQSQVLPSTPPAGYQPFTNYACDQASLIELNGSGPVIGENGICCSDPSLNCSFGSQGTSCPSKTVDDYTYTLGICALPSSLIPVATVKSQLDTFFTNLDSNPGGNPNYFVTTITPLAGSSVQSIQEARRTIDSGIGVNLITEADRGDRYLAFGSLVGNGSLSMDITTSDYSPVLDQIGQVLIQKKGTFTLNRAPTDQEEMQITIIHADGSTTIVPDSEYTIEGNQIVFTDVDYVLTLASTDKISISYQPKTAL